MENRIYITTTWDGRTTIDMDDIWEAPSHAQIPIIRRAGEGFVITLKDGQGLHLDNMQSLLEVLYVTAYMFHAMKRVPHTLSDTYSVEPHD